jgi:hypothetical protein
MFLTLTSESNKEAKDARNNGTSFINKSSSTNQPTNQTTNQQTKQPANQPIPQVRGFHKKLTGSQVVENFCILWNPVAQAPFTRAPPPPPTCPYHDQVNAVRASPSHFLKIHLKQYLGFQILYIARMKD